MRKLIDISSFKREDPKHFNLLNSVEKDSGIKYFFSTIGGKAHWKTAFKFLLVLLIPLFLWKFLPLDSFKRQNLLSIDPDKFQAVFLTNNQTYFGHISKMGEGELVLEKIYYFKASQETASGQQLILVKLTDEIYGPEDVIYIPSNQISFWQNLRDDSQVVKMIGQLENK